MFIIGSYHRLQSDPAETTVQLLAYLSQQLANSSVPAVPGLPSFAPASTSTSINVFWLRGFLISLLTAFVGILAKQWLRECVVYETSAEVYLRIRFFRFEGLKKWRVFEIVAFLPFVFQFSMLLFFLGLKEFLDPLDEHVYKAVTVLVYLWATLVVVFTLGPVFSARCPWKMPLLTRPLRCVRLYLFTGYDRFQRWRHDGYEVNWQWHPRSWFSDSTNWAQSVTSPSDLYATAIGRLKEFVFPDTYYFAARRPEEEDVSQSSDDDYLHLLATYELVQTDEHLLLVIGALWGEYSLNETMQCLEGVNKLRQSCIEDDWPIGSPSSYGPSLVPGLTALLIDKIQRYVAWSGTTTDDLVTALHFLLDPYSEKFIDGKVLWSLVGGMLLDYHFTLTTMRALVDRWEAIREIPVFPQLGQSNSKSTLSHRIS